MDNICRTCVKETTELVPMTTIIVSVGSKHELKDMYMEFTGMNVRFCYVLYNMYIRMKSK